MGALLATAFANLATPTNLFLMVIGVVVGIIFGCVPGLSAAMAIALFLPVTFGLPQYSAFALLMALYIGGVSGSLISAILINVPGSSQSIATCYDGHPMAVKGEAHRALGTGMLFSFIGTMFSLVILVFAAPTIASYAIKLGNFEFFSLVSFALILITCISGANILKALFAGLLGMGGSLANQLAYVAVQKTSKHPEKFGTGIMDGVIASETSNNASIGGAMIPLLALGIPGDGPTAMLLGAFMIQGLNAGPLLFTTNRDLCYVIFAAMAICTALMLVVEYFGIPLFLQTLKVPQGILLPCIVMLCCVGAFASGNKMFTVWTVLIFGAVGYLFGKAKIPGPPFILGAVLGPMIESNLRRALQVSRGSFLPFLTRPVSCVFIVASVNGVPFDRDLVIAGALLHDIGKLTEFAFRDGAVCHSDSYQLLRHPLSGAILAHDAGLPDALVHLIAVHSFEGERSYQTAESAFVRKLDIFVFENSVAGSQKR